MEFELRQFPLCEHDDLLDTMTFLNRISIIKPEKVKDIEDKPMTFGEYARLTDENRALNRNIWSRLYAAN